MSSDTRHRPRRGRARIVAGVPYSDSESTLSLLPAAAQGEWLTRHRHLFSGRLLDSGCGHQPYRDWYAPLVDEVVTLDAVALDGVGVLGFGDRLPFRAASFDTVLVTEVLEHVENAERAADELSRVLRPGGHALITVPYLYPTHEAPYDFRRFTHFGLADLLRRHGFEVLSIDAKGGPGLLLAHYAVLAATQGLKAADRPAVRRALAAPQEAWIRKRRNRGQVTGVQGLAGVMSLGYMAAARRVG